MSILFLVDWEIGMMLGCLLFLGCFGRFLGKEASKEVLVGRKAVARSR